jgi:hypothetical protein
MQRQGRRAFLSLLFIAALRIASTSAQRPTSAADPPSSETADSAADQQTSLVSARLSDHRLPPVAGAADSTDPNSLSAVLARLQWAEEELAAARANLGVPPDADAAKPSRLLGTLSAFQLGTSELTGPSASNPNPGVVNESTVGVNWYWNQFTKMQFNWIHNVLSSQYHGLSNMDIFACRLQAEF